MNDAQPSSEARFCTECGRPVHPNARYCGVCGHPIARPANPAPLAATQLIPVPAAPSSQVPEPPPTAPVPVATPSIPPPVPLAATQLIPVAGTPSPGEALRVPAEAQPAPVPTPMAATQGIPVPRPSEDPTRLPLGSTALPPTEATQRIPVPVPVPVRDEHPSLATNPGLSPLPDFRPAAPAQAPAAVPPAAEMPVAITLHSAPEPMPEPTPTPAAPRKAPMWPWFLGGMVLMVILVGGFLLLTFRPRGEQRISPKLPIPAPQATPAPLPASATPGNAPEAPQELKPYLERAAGGDTKAMRMLGAFYTYGLNVPANREEGLRWYRKAAEAGDTTARQELQQLEGKH